MSRPPIQWWVRADNRAYGPYLSERLPGFVREGRLTPETSVANDASGPWWPAGRNPSLEELFAAPAPTAATEATLLREPQRPIQPQPVAQQPAPPQPAAPILEPAVKPELRAQAADLRAYLVFAELLEGRDVRFAVVLERLGLVARARPGVWLLRAGGDAAAVRNALSQALGEGESLMVVRAEAADSAWFNLGGEADRALRGLWTR